MCLVTVQIVQGQQSDFHVCCKYLRTCQHLERYMLKQTLTVTDMLCYNIGRPYFQFTHCSCLHGSLFRMYVLYILCLPSVVHIAVVFSLVHYVYCVPYFLSVPSHYSGCLVLPKQSAFEEISLPLYVAYNALVFFTVCYVIHD